MNDQNQTESDVTVEWGIRHSQGIATCSSESDARGRLPGFIQRYESNFRNKVEPIIVRREVTAWTPADPVDALRERLTTPPVACCCETSPPEFGGPIPNRDCPIHGEEARHG